MNSIKLYTSPKARAIHALLMMSLLCFALTCSRIYLSNKYTYLFLVWNLLLAWVPLWFANKAYKNYFSEDKNHYVILPCGFLWLLFFPNAPYIITDLIHLDGHHQVTLWFDALMIFSFALTGLITGYLSLYYIHTILEHRFNKSIGWVSVSLMMLLSGYGVYLGRVKRFNSWDIISNPLSLITDCIKSINNVQAIKMTVIFFLFLVFSYYILHSFIYINQQQKEKYDY